MFEDSIDNKGKVHVYLDFNLSESNSLKPGEGVRGTSNVILGLKMVFMGQK